LGDVNIDRVELLDTGQRSRLARRHQPETDSNYSNLLSIWDRLGGSYDHGPRFSDLRYGLDGFDDPEKQSLRGLLRMPFMSAWGRPGSEPNVMPDRSAPPPVLPWP